MNVLFIGNAIIDVISHLDEIEQVDPNFIGKMQIVSQNEINYKIKLLKGRDSSAFNSGGETGIRTLEGLASLPVFKTGAFDHSAISP